MVAFIYVALFLYGYILQYILYKFMKKNGYNYKKSKLKYVCIITGISIIILFITKINKHPYYFIITSILFVIIIYMSVIDWEQYIAPDILNIMLLIIGLLNLFTNFTIANFKNLILGFLVSGGLFYLLAYISEIILKIIGAKNTMGLGGGDIKLMACLGLIFGIRDVLLILILTSFIIIIPTVILIIKHKTFSIHTALTPYINIATILLVLNNKTWI